MLFYLLNMKKLKPLIAVIGKRRHLNIQIIYKKIIYSEIIFFTQWKCNDNGKKNDNDLASWATSV